MDAASAIITLFKCWYVNFGCTSHTNQCHSKHSKVPRCDCFFYLDRHRFCCSRCDSISADQDNDRHWCTEHDIRRLQAAVDTGRFFALSNTHKNALHACTHAVVIRIFKYKHTHRHPSNGLLSGSSRVSHYQKGETNLDFTEARDSEWQRHQLGHMQICTSLQRDNYASTAPHCSVFLQTRCPSCHPTNSVKALKALVFTLKCSNIVTFEGNNQDYHTSL